MKKGNIRIMGTRPKFGQRLAQRVPVFLACLEVWRREFLFF